MYMYICICTYICIIYLYMCIIYLYNEHIFILHSLYRQIPCSMLHAPKSMAPRHRILPGWLLEFLRRFCQSIFQICPAAEALPKEIQNFPLVRDGAWIRYMYGYYIICIYIYTVCIESMYDLYLCR